LPIKVTSSKGTFGEPTTDTNSNYQNKPKTKLMHAPSIPSHALVYGYEENARGELVRQANSTGNHNGTADDQVGPGQYYPKTVN
jgi:hypothetical protein